MASGFQTIRINTQERAISPDINRLQTFGSAGLAEMMRYLAAYTTTDDFDAGGNISEAHVGASPLYAKILNGYEVQPQAGAGQLSLQVSSGAAFVLVDDGDVDASKFKLAIDPGIASNGLLLMTANSSGSARIDVIEVQWSSIVTSTDNRDIFNTATGLFSATNVTKSTRGTLTDLALPNIRIRAGTPGAGFPGTVAGWLPLAVAYNPAGSTQCDDMDFWDVRPMVSDAVHGMGDAMNTYPRNRFLVGSVNNYDNSAKTMIVGKIDAEVRGKRVGGNILSSAPGVDANAAFDAQVIDNQASGMTFPVSPSVGLWYVYLVTPFGLPRWARYTRTGPRAPRSPRGLVVVSTIAPNGFGSPSSAIPLPLSTGLGGMSSAAICVIASTTQSSVPKSGVTDGRMFSLQYGVTIAQTSGSTSNAIFTLNDNGSHPANAKALLCMCLFQVSVPANTTLTQWGGQVFLGSITTDPSGDGLFQLQLPDYTLVNQTAFPVSQVVTLTFAIPLLTRYPSASATTRKLDVQALPGYTLSGIPSLTILGWELGSD